MNLSIIRNPHYIAIYMAIILIFVGAVLLLSGIYVGWKGYTIGTWPQTDARILSSEAKLKRTPRGYNYRVNVVYEYSVDDVTMQGTSVGQNGLHFSSLNKARQVAREQFFPGKTLKAYYNPSNPQDVFLEGGIPIFSIAFVAIGALFFSFGLLLMKHRNNLRSPQRT